MDHQTFKCGIDSCDETFSSKYNLQRHINSLHLKLRRFECEMCSKRFTSKQTLNEHLYIHTGERPFACTAEGCCRKFRQASQLYIHKRKHHSHGRLTLPTISSLTMHEGLKVCLSSLPRVSQVRRTDQTGVLLPLPKPLLI